MKTFQSLCLSLAAAAMLSAAARSASGENKYFNWDGSATFWESDYVWKVWTDDEWVTAPHPTLSDNAYVTGGTALIDSLHGSCEANFLRVAGSGTPGLLLTNSGSLHIGTDVDVGLGTPGWGPGFISQTDSSVQIDGTLKIDFLSSQYTLGGSSQLADYLRHRGKKRDWQLCHTGGTHMISNRLTLGDEAGSQGTYSLSGQNSHLSDYYADRRRLWQRRLHAKRWVARSDLRPLSWSSSRRRGRLQPPRRDALHVSTRSSA